jgi:exonuclease SbcC
MRLKSLNFCGLSEAFPSPVSVDFESLGPGLIALVGENGVGKSTLIGCVFAALFRQLPGQKRSLYDFCSHLRPEIDLTFSIEGASYRALHKIDPKARQMDSYLFDERGTALASGKKDAFQEAVAKRVGTAEMFLASYFSSQKRTGNFLGLERSERKQLFITELLGLERLRRTSGAAREQAEKWSSQILSLDGERRGIEQLLATDSEIEDPETLGLELTGISAEMEKFEAQRRRMEENLASLRAQEVERDAIGLRRQEVIGQLRKTDTSLSALEKQMDEDRRELARQPDARDVANQIRTFDSRIDQLHRELDETNAVDVKNRQIEGRIRLVESGLKEKRDELDRSRRESAELKVVPCGGQGWYAACPKIQRAIGARESLPELEKAIPELAGQLESQKVLLKELPADPAGLMRELQQCQQERRKVEAIRHQQEERKIIETRQQERATVLERLIEDKAGFEKQSQELARNLEKFKDLKEEITRTGRQLQQLISSQNERHARCEQLIARKAQAEQRLRQIDEARRRGEAVEGELTNARNERDDFDYLAKVFGPDEIQLCEIQSAGPGVSAIVNDLLEGCFDNKFEVRFRTQRPRADGKGMVDDFDIEVRNKTLDRVCLVDELSGGQFVLVNEAVNLGIAIYNMRQGEGVRHETLFRDETVGALDAKNAKEYVRMLRRAMEIGGFHQVIFICHAAQVWEMADQILCVANGRITLGNPADAAA